MFLLVKRITVVNLYSSLCSSLKPLHHLTQITLKREAMAMVFACPPPTSLSGSHTSRLLMMAVA